MLLYNKLDSPPPFNAPLAITIGNFDGVHLAHQMLLEKMKELAPKRAVLTFENHPREILNGEKKLLITHPHYRLKLLQNYGVDVIYQLPFTKEFSHLSAREFLRKLKEATHFTHLILGHDAALGRDREGTPERLKKLTRDLNFSLHYLPPLNCNNEPISSSRIREAIQSGDLSEAEQLLGREYVLYGKVQKGAQKGRLLGFQTANIQLDGLATPPFGVYVLRAEIKGKTHFGVGNIGVAPTLNVHRAPLLEAHFFDLDQNLYDQEISVTLVKYLREEKTFASPQELKKQIALDKEDALHFSGVDFEST
jgi:riboflavin kinase / FMN adenylyltransferase